MVDQVPVSLLMMKKPEITQTISWPHNWIHDSMWTVRWFVDSLDPGKSVWWLSWFRCTTHASRNQIPVTWTNVWRTLKKDLLVRFLVKQEMAEFFYWGGEELLERTNMFICCCLFHSRHRHSQFFQVEDSFMCGVESKDTLFLCLNMHLCCRPRFFDMYLVFGGVSFSNVLVLWNINKNTIFSHLFCWILHC